MAGFIVLNEKGAQPVVLPAAITMITETDAREENRTGQKNLSIHHGTTDSTPIHFRAEQWDVSAEDVRGALRAAGKDLVAIPYVWGDKTIGRYLVDPAALTHMTVSLPQQKKDGKAPHVGVIMSLKGGGYIETYEVPVAVMDDFVAKAVAANPALKRVGKEAATSRWYNGDFVMYDPAEIVRIYQNGYHQVNVLYRNGACSDFSLPRKERENQDYLQKIFARVARMCGGEQAMLQDKELLKRLSMHTSRHDLRVQKKVQHDFAATVAADRPDLFTFKTAVSAFYTSLDNAVIVRPQDKCLCIIYNEKSTEARGMHGGDSWVEFRDEAAARAALRQLPLLQRRVP